MPILNSLLRVAILTAIAAYSSVCTATEAVRTGGLVFQNETFHDLPFAVVWIDLDQDSLQLFWKRPDDTPLGNFHALRDWLDSQGEELVMATNSGIYAEDRTPLGLHIAGGRVLRALNPHKGGKSNFALKPNGVFFIDGTGAHILTTEAFAEAEQHPELAVQSGPLLVIDNALHPKFNEDSTSIYPRNGIGVLSEKKIAIAISNWPVNLHTFASFFRDVLKCPNALYLDGSLSGLYAPALDRTYAGGEYVGMLAVTRKKPAGEGADE